MGGSEDSTDSHSSNNGTMYVFFVTFGLIIGAITREINKRTRFPYTPLLLIIGLVLGYFRDILGHWIGGGTELISHMDPHLILLVFIPVLLFEEGFNCDWYVFKKSFSNIMILAVPGIFWGIILLAVSLKIVLGYQELKWSQVLTIGSVLSATDAVAVVSLLKQLGAHVRFNTLISGESLMNDGTTIVFFLMFIGAVKGQQTTPMDFVSNVVRIAVGGPLIAIVLGAITAYCLSRIIRDDIQTINVTFIACYFSFWVSEYTFLKISGVIVVVLLALYLAANARTKIHAESQHSLHSVWSYVQYVCETIIFILTGIIIGAQLLSKSTIGFTDWVRLLLFYVLMNVIRGIMVFTLLPFLKMFGYGLNSKQFIVLVYGGLRGALGLCLALIVALDSQIQHVRFKELTIFYLSGMVILTMLVNGTTCGYLVDYIGMIERPPIKQKLYSRCLEEILNKTHHQMDQLRTNRFLQLVDWGKVEFYLGDQDVRQKINQLNAQMNRQSKIVDGDSTNQLGDILKNKDAQNQLRYKTIKLVQTAVWERFQNKLCEENAAKLLDQVCMINLDETKDPIKFWQNMTPSFISHRMMTFLLKIQKMPVVGVRARNQIVTQLYSVYQSASTMIVACEEAMEIMENFPVTDEYHIVQKQLKQEVEKAESYLVELENQFPDLVSILQMKKAVCTILQQRKKDYHQYKKDGFIDLPQLSDALLKLDERILGIDNLEMGLPQFSYYNLQYPIFASLTTYELQGIIGSSREVSYGQGQTLYRQNQDIRQIFLIVQGSVSDRVGDESIIRSTGGFMSPANVLARNGKSYSTASTITNCQLRAIPMHVVWELMKNPNFRYKIFSRSISYFVKLFKQRAGALADMDQNVLTQYARKSNLEMIPNNYDIELEFGGYLFEGQIKDESGEVVNRYSYLNPGKYTNVAPIPVSIIRFISKKEDGKKHKRDSRHSVMDASQPPAGHKDRDIYGSQHNQNFSRGVVEPQEVKPVEQQEYTQQQLQYYYWYMQQMQQEGAQSGEQSQNPH